MEQRIFSYVHYTPVLMTSPRRLGYKNSHDVGPIRLHHTYKFRSNVRYSKYRIPDRKIHGPHVDPMNFVIRDSLVGCAVDGDMSSLPTTSGLHPHADL